MSRAVLGLAEADLRLVYHGRNTIGGFRRTVTCFAGKPGYLIHVGRSSFRVDRSDGRVHVLREASGGREPDTAERAPAGAISLALGGVFCLHASAVATPGGVLAFVGRSGKGKSTLAAHLSSGNRRPWPLVSDDILAVSLGSSPPVVLRFSFPDTARAAAAERLPLRAVYVLREWKRETVAVAPLPSREAFLAFARHGVATRLLDPALRVAHFEGWVSASRTVPVLELFYPRRLSALGEVRRRLEPYLL